MGVALPGVRLTIRDGELLADPASVPTFFLRYLDPAERAGGEPLAGAEAGDRAATGEPWATGDRVREEADGHLAFEGRLDDVIVSAGYRIGPFEVESALISHPAVAEAAVVAAPDAERGSVVRAVVVLRDGAAATDDLRRALQDHVKEQTAPYKYPRVIDFAAELPKTSSGKIRRALLRDAT
jgi:acyl-coenzyme A synthetase/AMP-(fatty) acid ligase